MDTRSGHEFAEYNRLYKEMDELYHSIALKSNLSDSAFNIFYTLCEFGNGCLQKDICNVAYTSKQTINSSIKNLEKAGYIRLEPGKGRDKLLFLTPAGEQLVEEKIKPVIDAEKRAFAELTREERAELLRISKKNITQLREKINQIFKTSSEDM